MDRDTIIFTGASHTFGLGLEWELDPMLNSENYLQKDTNYDLVDTFRGSIEESGMSSTAKRLSEDDFIYNNFIHNIDSLFNLIVILYHTFI